MKTGSDFQNHSVRALRAPTRLLRAYAHDPLAIGVYLAVARCALIARRPVPLSAADLAEWSLGTRVRHLGIARRVRRLIDDGWLVAEGGAAVKPVLLPTWGRGKLGDARPWQPADARLGRPEHVATALVPTELFDHCIGRIDPKPGRTPALVTRYFDAPLLDFSDIGAYALAGMGLCRITPRLVGLGLVVDGVVQQPRSLDELLAVCAAGEVEGVRLSALGSQRRARVAHAVPASGSGNGSASGSVSGSAETPASRPTFSAAARPERPVHQRLRRPSWDSWDSPDSRVRQPDRRDQAPRMGGGAEDLGDIILTDPTSDALLAAMGVRNRAALRGVAPALIAAWANVIAHPALAARFADPVAFAVSQLRQGNAPPAEEELARWADHARRQADPHETWRYLTPDESVLDGAVSLAPLAEACEPDEEVYRALIARAAR